MSHPLVYLLMNASTEEFMFQVNQVEKKLDIGGGDLERAMEVTRTDLGPDLEQAQVECTA